MQDKPNALAASAQPANLDPYEAKYMAGDLVVFSSKARMPWQIPASVGVVALYMVVWGALHGRPLMGLLVGAFVALLGLFFSVIRVTVLPTSVNIQYGSFGPTIPLESIESVEAIVHDYRSPLRWGISLTWKGEWLYTIAGDRGRAVKIVWRNARGRRRVHIIGSLEPEQLAEAIRTARKAATPTLQLPQQDPPDP